MLSLLGPKPFAAAESLDGDEAAEVKKEEAPAPAPSGGGGRGPRRGGRGGGDKTCYNCGEVRNR